MFPYLNDFMPINSSTIEISWYPSPNIAGIDLANLSGTINLTAYAISRSSVSTGISTFPMTKLNETGKIVFAGLQPNTIYSVRFDRAWQGTESNAIISQDINPKLMRTYATGK